MSATVVEPRQAGPGGAAIRVPEDAAVGPSRIRGLVPVAAGLLVGAPLVVLAYAYAAGHRTNQLVFDLFWVGFLAFALPLAWRAVSFATPSGERWVLIGALGAWDFVPKLLRDPSGPLYSDELAHVRQAADVAGSGHLYGSNSLIPLIPQFPGEQALLAALHEITGLSIWAGGELVLAFFHVATVLGMMLLGQRLLNNRRAGAAAAVVYCASPGFMFFDSQLSYESLGLPLLIWTLVAAAHLTGPDRSVVPRGWVSFGTVTGLACVVTHHLSSYVCAGMLIVLAGADAAWRRRDAGRTPTSGARHLPVLAAIVTTAAVAWLIIEARGVFSYYAPYTGGGVSQLLRLLHRTTAARHLFGGTTSPEYEVICAFIAPIAVVVVVVAGVALRRRLLAAGPTLVALSAAGALAYFASLPFALTTSGSEGARRSWSFAYIGLSLLAAFLVDHTLVKMALRPAALRGALVTRTTRRVGRHLPAALFGVVLGAVLIGNTASSVDVEYRFPGPYVYGSDTRSMTAELRFLSGWFASQGANLGVVTDRYTGLALAGFSGQNVAQPSTGFPVWDLYLDSAGPPRALLAEVGNSPYSYLVVDAAMARHIPAIGIYFTAGEPGAGNHTAPVPVSNLARYQQVTWATEVFSSTNYSVYRMDMRSLIGGDGGGGGSNTS